MHYGTNTGLRRKGLNTEMRSRFEEKTKQNNTFSVQIFKHRKEVESALKGDETTFMIFIDKKK